MRTKKLVYIWTVYSVLLLIGAVLYINSQILVMEFNNFSGQNDAGDSGTLPRRINGNGILEVEEKESTVRKALKHTTTGKNSLSSNEQYLM